MASQSLLTYGSKISNIEQVYYSPIVQIPPSYLNTTSLYCVLSKVDNWIDDNNPPAPTQDQKNIKNFLKNVFVAKHVTSNDISPVIHRIDWVYGTVYEYYRDDIDMLQTDDQGLPLLQFYIINKYDQVFKCIWNNNGGPSTYEPFFEPGSYNTNNIYQNLDGYKWHYVFTVDTSSKIKFMDSTWVPVPVSKSLNPLLSPEGYGGIEVINVISGGNGYDPANSIITVSITGDGSGANATAVVANGSITNILMNSVGTNYTYANASIITANGSGAILSSNTVSPIGGHGFDPISELGCSNVMISVEFNGSEGQVIPTDITYHQVGLLVNPTSSDNSPFTANGQIYDTSTILVMSSGFGVYVNDEIVYQGSSLESATFFGTVLEFDPATNKLSLINTTGSLINNTPIIGNSSGTGRTLLSFTSPKFITISGYVAYMENRSAIQRSTDGIEQFKIVLGY